MERIEKNQTVELRTGEKVPLQLVQQIQNGLLSLFVEHPDVLNAATILSRDINRPVSYQLIQKIKAVPGFTNFMTDPIIRSIVVAMTEGKDFDLKLVDPITGKPMPAK